jgi:hypothetical protein
MRRRAATALPSWLLWLMCGGLIVEFIMILGIIILGK